MLENGCTLPPFVTDLYMFGQSEFLLLKGSIYKTKHGRFGSKAVHHQNLQIIYKDFSSAFEPSLISIKHHVILGMTSCKCKILFE